MNKSFSRQFVSGCLIAAGIFIFACQQKQEKLMPTPPSASMIPETLSTHGDIRIDPYYWLRNREDSAVTAYLEAENNYTDTMLAHTKALQEELFTELKGRMAPADSSAPYLNRGYYYYTRFLEGKEYPVYCRKKAVDGAAEEVFLDANAEAANHSYYQVGSTSISPDTRILAYSEDIVSRRLYTIRFKNLDTGELFAESILNTSGGCVWANDNRTVFYTVKDETLREYRIMRHVLGSDPAQDVLIYEEKDPTFSTYISKTRSGKYLIIGSYATVSNEYHILEADNPTGKFRLFQARERDLEYSIDHQDGRFLVVTNLGARNFRLMECPEQSTGKSAWKEILPNREDVLLEGVHAFSDFLAVAERKEGIEQIRLLGKDGSDHYIAFPQSTYVAYLGPNAEYSTDNIRIRYNSLTTPNTDFDYSVKEKKLTTVKEQTVLGGFDKNNYESERLYAKAEDGTTIPISLVYRKGFKKDGSMPLLLYGYGSYGYSMDPGFSSDRLSLLDRGFAFAIAHIRGGQEMGRYWYDDGKLLKKKNTFTDFIACASHLISESYTSPRHLYAMGGSAGGLLMGAVVNMRPDLFSGVVAAVPFVDVVTTMLDESIPLTTSEYDEWGNPNDKAYYDYIKSYSPYDNVTAQAYPAMLITTGLHDSQVQYWEPAKWVARLRTVKTDKNPLLLHTDMSAGHGGASGRFSRLKEVAMTYAFLIDREETQKN